MRVKDKDGRFVLATKVVKEVISEMPSGTRFYGWQLAQWCAIKCPELKNMYVDTFLREMRGCCKDKYKLISRSESLYQKVGNR